VDQKPGLKDMTALELLFPLSILEFVQLTSVFATTEELMDMTGSILMPALPSLMTATDMEPTRWEQSAEPEAPV
jgi:hypothetical protein